MKKNRRHQITIGGYQIGENKPAFIIAEAGVNHNGNIKLAQKMVDAAKMAGADAVKFQTFKTEKLITHDAPKAKYQKAADSSGSQYAMLKKLEFSESDFKMLFGYCRKKKIIFLSTPFDRESAELLNDLGVPAFKVSSGDLTDIPLLQKVAGFKKPIILSTGMSTLKEVKKAVRKIYLIGNNKLILLHCTSNYPAKYGDINLMAMETLRKEFNLPVGYSDHTEGIEVPIAAVAMGACVIEKHFTLDKDLPGPDHKASLEPDEFGKMVKHIKNIEKAVGNGVKKPREYEAEIKKIARKSVVTARDIPKGATITWDMLAIKRPGTGIEPMSLGRLVGRHVKRAVKKDRVLTWGLIS